MPRGFLLTSLATLYNHGMNDYMKLGCAECGSRCHAIEGIKVDGLDAFSGFRFTCSECAAISVFDLRALAFPNYNVGEATLARVPT
jgi:hypothetical protein